MDLPTFRRRLGLPKPERTSGLQLSNLPERISKQFKILLPLSKTPLYGQPIWKRDAVYKDGKSNARTPTLSAREEGNSISNHNFNLPSSRHRPLY